MVKGKENAELCMGSGENICDRNSVTKLPALREVIKWFKGSFAIEHVQEYMSVSVYELTKYIHVLENFGIDAVDDMILMVSDILQQIWGKKAYIGHISDDRFVVITAYPKTESVDNISDILNADNKVLQREIDKYNTTAGESYYIELDYGYIVKEPGWEGGFEGFLKLANSEVLFNHLQKDLSITNSSHTVLWKHQEVFNLLIEKNLFHYHFQPIVDAQEGKVFGYEALMRTAPVINMKPLEVIEVATNLGKLYDIEMATMHNMLEYLSQNYVAFEDKKLFINSIPAYMLNALDWEGLVDKYGLLMDKLVVEMTEQTEMNDEHLARFRNRLKKHNISLAIDDYGTGFSNLSNLIRYSPDYVKIDRALIQDIQEKPKIQKLVAGIIEFIHENGYSALAEGVENYEELKTMIGLGADYIQGFYLARPDAKLQVEIGEKFREEIITLNLMRSEYIVKVYSPAENEIVNLSQLATQHYNNILIDKENVVIEGIKGTPITCSITVKDGVNTSITLRDVSITTEKEVPLIDIGSGSNVVINVDGTNEILNRGIRVPQGSELKLTGEDGSLHIHCEMLNSYAIGGDKESTYGNINIEYLPQLIIDTNGENCIGIGGGRNSADSKIRIIRSGVRLECAGGNAIGIGSFDGNSSMEIQNAGVELNMSCGNAVGIGALKGNTNVIMHNYSLNIVESGNNLCGIGVLSNGEGSIEVFGGTIECDIRGKNIVCLGSDYGALDCNVKNSNTIFYCEGNSVVGIGDMNGRGNVNIKDANLNMTILAKEILDIGSKSGRLELVGSKRNIKINE